MDLESRDSDLHEVPVSVPGSRIRDVALGLPDPDERTIWIQERLNARQRLQQAENLFYQTITNRYIDNGSEDDDGASETGSVSSNFVSLLAPGKVFFLPNPKRSLSLQELLDPQKWFPKTHLYGTLTYEEFERLILRRGIRPSNLEEDLRNKLRYYLLVTMCLGGREDVIKECYALLQSEYMNHNRSPSIRDMEEILEYWGRGKPMEFSPGELNIRLYLSTWLNVPLTEEEALPVLTLILRMSLDPLFRKNLARASEVINQILTKFFSSPPYQVGELISSIGLEINDVQNILHVLIAVMPKSKIGINLSMRLAVYYLGQWLGQPHCPNEEVTLDSILEMLVKSKNILMETDLHRLYYIFSVIDFILNGFLNNDDLDQEKLESIMDVVNVVRNSRMQANKQIEHIFAIVNRMNAKWSVKHH